jgi:hypothetical protein
MDFKLKIFYFNYLKLLINNFNEIIYAKKISNYSIFKIYFENYKNNNLLYLYYLKLLINNFNEIMKIINFFLIFSFLC